MHVFVLVYGAQHARDVCVAGERTHTFAWTLATIGLQRSVQHM